MEMRKNTFVGFRPVPMSSASGGKTGAMWRFDLRHRSKRPGRHSYPSSAHHRHALSDGIHSSRFPPIASPLYKSILVGDGRAAVGVLCDYWVAPAPHCSFLPHQSARTRPATLPAGHTYTTTRLETDMEPQHGPVQAQSQPSTAEESQEEKSLEEREEGSEHDQTVTCSSGFIADYVVDVSKRNGRRNGARRIMEMVCNTEKTPGVGTEASHCCWRSSGTYPNTPGPQCNASSLPVLCSNATLSSLNWIQAGLG